MTPKTPPTSPPDAGRRRPAGPAAVRRMVRLDAILGSGKAVDLVRLAREQEWEISHRTLKRDIERLRDEHHAPIIWDAAAHGYRYTRPYKFCEHLRLDADEALALALAGRTFAAWAGTPLGAALTAALGKIARAVGDTVSLPADTLADWLYQPDAGDTRADAEHRHFAALLDHLRARRELKIAYRKPRSPRAETRRVRPLHLAHLEHRWVLVAHDVAKKAPRHFLLARIEKMETTGRVFDPPPAAEIRARLRGNLGRFAGEADHEIRLRVDAEAAAYIRETPWHASQTHRDLPDGGAEVTLLLNGLVDIERRILACGGRVEVLAPAQLREAVAASARRLLETHVSALLP